MRSGWFGVGIGLFFGVASAQLTPEGQRVVATARANYTAINQLATAGNLNVKRRSCPGRGPELTLMTDRAGLVRRYIIGVGTDDSALTVQQDYDSSGKLTFALATYGNVMGTRNEWRLYFSSSGRMVDLKRTGKTGFFDEMFLWSYISRDPMADWKANWCG